MKAFAMMITLVITPLFAQGAALKSCKGFDSIANLVETKEVGQYRLALVTANGSGTGNDAVLLVFSFGDDGYFSCKAITTGQRYDGFCSVDLKAVQSSGASDVDLSIPVFTTYDQKGKCEKPGTIKVSIREHYPAPVIKLLK